MPFVVQPHNTFQNNYKMKHLSLFTIILLLILTACSDDKTSNTDPKKRAQPNLEARTKAAPTTKKANPDRKPSTPEQLKEARAIIAATTAEDLAAIDGKKIFKMYCTTCHGFTGDLNVNGATDLTTSTLPLEERVAQVYNGRGLMTPFKGLLKDKQIVAVGKYVESLRK